MHVSRNISKFATRKDKEQSKKKRMIVIPIKDGENIERALKRFKRKFEKTGAVKELRGRQAFEKPSITRRTEIKKAVYIENLQRSEDN